MTTLTDEELGTTSSTTTYANTDQVYRGTFEGRLVGTATTAKQLEVPFKLELQGDVAGNVDISGKQGVILQTTVSHATEADRAEYAGNTALATNANYADLANLANFAVESGKAEEAKYSKESNHAKESDHSLTADRANIADRAYKADSANKDNKGNVIDETYGVDKDLIHKDEYLTNAIIQGLATGTGTIDKTTLTITIDKIASGGLTIFEFAPFPTAEEDRDTTKIYVSQANKQFYIFNTQTSKWENLFDTELQNIIRKNDGNDYYDDSDITSLIYAGNGAGTIRNEVANGNFARVHPGQTIRGKVTGTTYIVVGCNIYLHRGDTDLTRNHIGLMPIQLVGNTGNLLWSGKKYQGASANNSDQGYAPWASDNDTEGKNQTSCYKDSYIANTVLPKVDNLWLKPDFENQGISVLTFRNLEAISFDTNATCMSNPNWRGCATNWGWASRRLVLPSELEIYGHYNWAGSPWESGSQHTQLPLYRHKEIHKVYPRVDIWLKDSASTSYACNVVHFGLAHRGDASGALRVCPLFLIA